MKLLLLVTTALFFEGNSDFFDTADAQVRDLDGVIQKLNTTYQQVLKDEQEQEAFFLS